MKEKSHILAQVKANQEELHEDCQLSAANQRADDSCDTLEKGHGRIEKRTVKIYRKPWITDPNWAKLISVIICLTRERTKQNPETKQWVTSLETSYYASGKDLSAQEACRLIRDHWRIENCNHYARDTAIKEDASTIRINPGAMATLRSWTLNLLRINGDKPIKPSLYLNSLSINRIFCYPHFL